MENIDYFATVTVEEILSDGFDWNLVAEEMGITKADIYNDENDLPF